MAAEDFAENLLLDEKSEYGLTANEIGAINLYTQGWIPASKSLYSILNEHLRSEERASIQPFFPYLKLLFSGFEKLPKKERTVFRGVKKDLSTDYKKGKRLTWWSFSSCTLELEVLQNELFLGTKGKRTIFTLTSKLGVEIMKYSMYKNEAEILFPPGIRLTVSSILNQGDFQLVHLTESGGLLVA